MSESATRAHLVSGATAITLPITNAFDKPVQARVSLRWLGPDDAEHGRAIEVVDLKPGKSVLTIALPLNEKYEPLDDRLLYEVEPSYGNLTAFNKVRGALSFPNIADYAFSIRVVNIGLAKPGQPYELHVLTTHPITGQPVSGVSVRATGASGTSDANGIAVLRISPDPDSTSSDTVIAKLGDFEQRVEMQDLAFDRGRLDIQCDKPIYQPGQIMHIRILAFGANGKAKSGVEHELEITNIDTDVEYAATLRTSPYGIAATDWEIPANAKSGEYYISVRNDDDEPQATRQVNIRRYELPSFRVIARPLRSYYLLNEKATLEVRAEYLFGKPLTGGKVRITEGDEEEGNDFAEGSLSSDGAFRTSFILDDRISREERFHDRHFTAFVTDSTTNRTEQKKFDLRVSPEALHIYLSKQQLGPEGWRIYVTTDSPDGSPLKAHVEVLAKKLVVARGETNRFGIGRLDLGKLEGEILLRAVASDGRRAEITEHLGEWQGEGLWLTTDRAIYRTGQEIRCKVSSSRKNLSVQVIAWNAQNRVVFSRDLKLADNSVAFEFPYAAEFGRALGIAAIAGPVKEVAAVSVISPGPDDLIVRATPAEKTYRPGASAQLRFEASAQAALGIAIVDQSVLERAATDAAFGRRRWFQDNANQPRVGDVTLSDLLNMDPAKIDADIELLAEVLLQAGSPAIFDSFDDTAEAARHAYERASEKTLEPLQKKLDDIYLQTLSYPRSEAMYFEMGDTALRDPWLQPYMVSFSVNGVNDVMELCSSGPDKTPNTDDDFCLWQLSRKWFARYESLMRDALSPLQDYPATLSGFLQVFDNAGLKFDALRDPWKTPLRLETATERDRRVLQVRSAGPDRTFGTADDFLVCEFSGSYFNALGTRIQAKVNAASQFPTTDSELYALARAAGVELETLRDPWGHPYFVNHHADEIYYDKVSFYTFAEYGQVAETRKQLTPSRHRLLVTELRSAGPDGIRGTYDDFSVYSFVRVMEPPSAAGPEASSKPVRAHFPPGRGLIVGTVRDPSGAVIPDVTVTVNDTYVTHSDKDGKYIFAGVPQGVYRLRFESLGFQQGILQGLPVASDEVTNGDFMMQIGTSTETVQVSAGVVAINAQSAQLQTKSLMSLQPGVAVPASTPRIREYFPETLYWQPELVTDAAGHAAINVKLADNVTTWHVAVMASTVDGKVTESESEVRAFQPFQVDLDVPPVLTAGDRLELPVPIRNYLDQPQNVTVKVSGAPGFALERDVRQPGVIAKDSVANVLLPLLADNAMDKATLQVSAVGGTDSDAIAKSALIHPNGQRMEKSVTNILNGTEALRINVPAGAIPGSVKAEVKVYPSLLARLFEAVETLLQRPYGCGEQTISSSYPSLLVLKALKQAGLQDENLEARARRNLQIGYQRLMGYQSAEGGFKYWAKSNPNAALTAYALRFLDDLKEFMEVDQERITAAAKWLSKQDPKEPDVQAYSLQALVNNAADEAVLTRLTALAKKAAEFQDPYAMAAFASAAMDAKKPELAESTMRRLSEMAQDEQGAAYWSLRSNTPFYGWGRSGQVETTGMVLSAMAKWQKLHRAESALDLAPLINRAVLFLLKSSGPDGAWMSGQATVQALTALLENVGKLERGVKPVDVIVNGSVVTTLKLSDGRAMQGPDSVDVSHFLRSGANEVSLRAADARPVETQFNATWYEKWTQPVKAKEFALETNFSSTAVKVNEAVTCSINVSRPNFRGYGMMIAEVGLPPGAEVDRGSLEAVLSDPKGGVDSYEVAPDHVTFYVWPRAGDAKFQFDFRPRFGMDVRMAESVLYDYYNPDARVVLVPAEFSAQ